MKSMVKGNIWDYHYMGAYVIVPVRVGWTDTSDNLLFSGLAKQTAQRFPDIAKYWSSRQKAFMKTAEHMLVVVPVHTFENERIILCPVTPLNTASPSSPYEMFGGFTQHKLLSNVTKKLCKMVQDKPNKEFISPLLGLSSNFSITDSYALMKDQFHGCGNFTLIVSVTSEHIIEKVFKTPSFVQLGIPFPSKSTTNDAVGELHKYV